MTRQELLNNLNNLLDDAAKSDNIVSSSAKYQYLAEGQEKFCEETGLFIDATTTDIVSITTAIGTKSYALDDRILKVLEVWDGSRKLSSLEDDINFINHFYYDGSGVPYLWRTDYEPGKIQLHPTPPDVRTLTMRVWRYPINSIVTSDPELPTRFQWACIEWAAWKVLQIQDAEVRNKAKATEHYANFVQYCVEGKRYLNRLSANSPRVSPSPVFNLGMTGRTFA